jgi:plasmid stabilization system protein ParE
VNIGFHPAAAEELAQAIDWYENERKGLGRRFSATIDETITRIVRYPTFNSQISTGVYRALVKKFPYGIIYTLGGEDLSIFSIAHHHGKPLYLIARPGL